ncbi:FkbM family methyltransferase [Flammeovirga sp. EKP202]|uniref:FkbM family methyltransferase n=1 Tax=Flammeovirga sp. EKP202 TaxID=2770592 RepID=UPI00165F0927|nr:FkbM family methyltransferase [Flammeovirga sp. EKP202]MBD0401313.1 FkbM family methyltransferase [Flammeovirga sp. EKP202]
MSYSPIILFVYNRAWHAEQVLMAIHKNPEFQDSPFYIFCDGPRNDASQEELQAIKATRDIVKNQRYWSKQTQVIESDQNKGLAASIIEGVSKVIEQHGQAIILEDDIVTSQGFLKFMNEALELYREDDHVMHINAYLPKSPFQKNNFTATSFYSTHMSCWGWATWKTSWKLFNADTESLIKNLNNQKLEKTLDLNGYFHGTKQLVQNLNGEIKTWAIKWGASILLNKGICLNTSQSLVNNIGMDGSGVNSGKLFWDPFKTEVTNEISISKLDNEDIEEGNRYFMKFYRYVNVKGFRRRLIKFYFYFFKSNS